jgi:hypothetical protein
MAKRHEATNVTEIAEYKGRDIIIALRDLLHRAEQGRLRAFAFCIKTGPHRHRIGFAGDYYTDPAQALFCASRMQYKANQLVSARDFEPDTESMPL